jgi:phage terminase large subunit GpA-like protein
VEGHLKAEQQYQKTGSQEPIKAFVNTSLGLPYAPRDKIVESEKLNSLKNKLQPELKRMQVAAGARFVTTAVDVQKTKFVVKTQAWSKDSESWIVERIEISKNKFGEQIYPFDDPEDWHVLDSLFEKKYKVQGKEISVNTRIVVCDSGGAGAATTNSYKYSLRRLRSDSAIKFCLLKGSSHKTSPRIQKSLAKKEGTRGDLWVINPNIFKDEVSSSLQKKSKGANYLHLPGWLSADQLLEFLAEERKSDGTWKKINQGARNEELDLACYNRAAYSILGGDKIDWENPPSWCEFSFDHEKFSKKEDNDDEDLFQFMREHSAKVNG